MQMREGEKKKKEEEDEKDGHTNGLSDTCYQNL